MSVEPREPAGRKCHTMADFIQTTNTKSAVRDLSVPIANITAFDALVQDIIDTNPFGCTAYVEGGMTIDPVVRSQERYDAKIVYENLEADKVGDVSVKTASVAAFGTAAAKVLADVNAGLVFPKYAGIYIHKFTSTFL